MPKPQDISLLQSTFPRTWGWWFYTHPQRCSKHLSIPIWRPARLSEPKLPNFFCPARPSSLSPISRPQTEQGSHSQAFGWHLHSYSHVHTGTWGIPMGLDPAVFRTRLPFSSRRGRHWNRMMGCPTHLLCCPACSSCTCLASQHF